jgi:hypothetical protein
MLRTASSRPVAALTLLAASLAACLTLGACGPRAVDVARAEGDFHYEWGRYEEAAPAYLEIIDRYPGDWRRNIATACVSSNSAARRKPHAH